MDKKKVYKVLFKGVILTGFEKDQVIDNVHKITRIPKETIARKFFSGKTVVIRHADSQEYASALQKTFSQAGIETYIEKVTQSEVDTLTSLTSEQSSSDTSEPTEENLENSQFFNIPESDNKSVKESIKTQAPPLPIQKRVPLQLFFCS